MKSSNPNSGCNEVDVASTLDTWRPDPSLNQGGIAIVEASTVGALAARDYKGVGNQYVAENKCVVETSMLMFDTQFGSNANVFENQSPTLKASQASPSVAYGITGNAIGRQDHNGPNGPSHTEEGGPMFTLTSTDIHAVATTMVVRRLTPLECERLMGWPDDHTRYKADGTEQADTHRYKQCGNGVASPVAEWIGEQLRNL
jgi:DNA (cytosine-5)-methyltransferase 1